MLVVQLIHLLAFAPGIGGALLKQPVATAKSLLDLASLSLPARKG